ncbi:MAG: hypothetical protein C0485_14500 [Pirellula sp.]|nr:hypothetical protein [Pirellula sp.]
MILPPEIIEHRLPAILQLCRQYRVKRLELFGSAATGKFGADSDLDFVVDFHPQSPADRADAYFGLLADLQDLFQREIDLVEQDAISNPYLKRSIEAAHTVLYAA